MTNSLVKQTMKVAESNKYSLSQFMDFFFDVETNEPIDDHYYLCREGDETDATAKTEEGVELFLIECVGGEGEGEHAHSIWRVGDTFWKADYSYYSYDGMDFDYAEVYRVEQYEYQAVGYRRI